MGKRSNFERNPRDYYPTPYEAVLPLLAHVSGDFIELCAGDGRLIRHLEKNGLACSYACDIEPAPCEIKMKRRIKKQDVLFFNSRLPTTKQIITNPPWERETLHAMIERFRAHAPTWLLFDADWMFTGQARPYLPYCEKIVSVGRVSWLNNDVSGKDNCCWYHFIDRETQTTFIP